MKIFSKGVAIVEVAIALPIILVAAFIIVDSIFYFSRTIAFNYAAQRAATLAGELNWEDENKLAENITKVKNEALKSSRIFSFGERVRELSPSSTTTPEDPSSGSNNDLNEVCPPNVEFPSVTVANNVIEIELCNTHTSITPLFSILTGYKRSNLPLRSKAVIFPPDHGAGDIKANYCTGGINCECDDDNQTSDLCNCSAPFIELSDGSCGCDPPKSRICTEGCCCPDDCPPEVQDPSTCVCTFKCDPNFLQSCKDQFTEQGFEPRAAAVGHGTKDGKDYCYCYCSQVYLSNSCTHASGDPFPIKGYDWISRYDGTIGNPDYEITHCGCLTRQPGSCDPPEDCNWDLEQRTADGCFCYSKCPGNKEYLFNGQCSCGPKYDREKCPDAKRRHDNNCTCACPPEKPHFDGTYCVDCPELLWREETQTCCTPCSDNRYIPDYICVCPIGSSG